VLYLRIFANYVPAEIGSPSKPFLERRERSIIMKPPSFLEWYRILQAHHQWAVFQAIRYALWLAR
jgi:hypothetical protein